MKECEKSKRNVDIYIYKENTYIHTNCIHIDTYILTLQTTFSQEMLFRVLLKSFISYLQTTVSYLHVSGV